MKTIKLYILISVALITACSSTQDDKLSFSNIVTIDFFVDDEELNFYSEETYISIISEETGKYWHPAQFNNALLLPNFEENKYYGVCFTYKSKIHDNFKVCFDSIKLFDYEKKWKLEVDTSPKNNENILEKDRENIKTAYFFSLHIKGGQFLGTHHKYEY